MLKSRVALVTGGTGALGSVIANRLVAEGAIVTATYRDSAHQIDDSHLSEPGVNFIRTDATDERAVQKLYDTILSAAGHVDIVVNTIGGFLSRKPLTEVSVEEWDRMMNVNLKSTFLSTREALRRMKEQSYGRIINISAMAGLNPTPGRIAYAISKSGVSILTDLVAQEVKGGGITVNAIAPSIIRTKANSESMPGEDSSKWISPEQIADLVCYLCSTEAGGITGTTIKAYGGV
jgi:NAD(P)-dependent dehydrogenase (short-subunit alcohol dehydrogenase family)